MASGLVAGGRTC